jgi:hypothetical protein
MTMMIRRTVARVNGAQMVGMIKAQAPHVLTVYLSNGLRGVEMGDGKL